jgi:hypothetical protein
MNISGEFLRVYMKEPMSNYLRVTNILLSNLGGISSPEIFPVESLAQPQIRSIEKASPKPGGKKCEPTAFLFFQGTLTRCYILGHIQREGGVSLPVVYATVGSGILMRTNGMLRPYFEPVIREVILLPENMGELEATIKEYAEAGLDIERFPTGDNSYAGIRKSAADTVYRILADVKQGIYLAFNEAIGSDDYLVLIDGSLRPDPTIMGFSNWVGIYESPGLNSHEEQASLGLVENEAGPPFKLGNNANGYCWHLRMFSDYRKDPSWGLIRVENALKNGEDMNSKIEAISSGILAEKYPIHPSSEKENSRLYPLVTARIFLRTQATDDKSILRYF